MPRHDKQNDELFPFLKKMSFPTDRLTIGSLIQKFPREFQWQEYDFFELGESKTFRQLFKAMDIERDLAVRAYRRVSGTADQPRPDRSNSQDPVDYAPRAELVSSLTQCYEDLAISDGPKSAFEKVKEIEYQAGQLAKCGPSR